MGLFSEYTKKELNFAHSCGMLTSRNSVFMPFKICDYVRWIQILKDDTNNTYYIFASHKSPDKYSFSNEYYSNSTYNCIISKLESKSLEDLRFRILFDKSLQDLIAKNSKNAHKRNYFHLNKGLTTEDWDNLLVPFSDDGHIVSYSMCGFINEKNLTAWASYDSEGSETCGYTARISGDLRMSDCNIKHLSDMIDLFGYNLKLAHDKSYTYLACCKKIHEYQYLPIV